jgi:hypothetical protein
MVVFAFDYYFFVMAAEERRESLVGGIKRSRWDGRGGDATLQLKATVEW